MPTKRLFFTLGEVRELLAKKYKRHPNDVSVYMRSELEIQTLEGLSEQVTDDHYIFQMDFED